MGMKFVLAIVIPPLAILLCGRIIQAACCGILFLISLATIVFSFGLLGWIVCAAWALAVACTADPVRGNLHMMHNLHQRHELAPAPDPDSH